MDIAEPKLQQAFIFRKSPTVSFAIESICESIFLWPTPTTSCGYLIFLQKQILLLIFTVALIRISVDLLTHRIQISDFRRPLLKKLILRVLEIRLFFSNLVFFLIILKALYFFRAHKIFNELFYECVMCMFMYGIEWNKSYDFLMTLSCRWNLKLVLSDYIKVVEWKLKHDIFFLNFIIQ